MTQFLKPNVYLPLVASFNFRGNSGQTTVDQFKQNSFYEAVTNISGETTLYLSKRPGVNQDAATFGTNNQIPYLIAPRPAATSTAVTQQWMFTVLGNDVRASSSTTTTTIVTAAGYAPVYVDRTAISGTETLVLQLRNAALAQTVWYSSAIATFTQITDADFTGLNIVGKMEFLDGWAFAITTNDRIYNSNINSLANWTAGQYITKQIRQDQSRGLARFGQQILAFGSETMEVFRNAGKESGSPLESVPSGIQRIGIPVQSGNRLHYYTTLGDKMYFFGQPKSSNKGIGIYVYDGGPIEKVSTISIDKVLDANSSSLYGIFSFVFLGQRAVALLLSDPSLSAENKFYMFFPDQKEWFYWTTFFFSPINSGEWFLGNPSFSEQKLHSFSSSGCQDVGAGYEFLHRFKFPSKGTPNQFMHFCGVNGDTNSVTLTVKMLDTDNSTTATVTKTIDLSSKSKIAHRCGMFQDRTIELSTSSSSVESVRLRSFFARVD